MNSLDEYQKELLEFLNDSFGVACNANDFFCYAAADMVLISPYDLPWVLPLYKEFGWDGLHACMAYIAKLSPLEPYKNSKYEEAYRKIEALNPEVFSEY